MANAFQKLGKNAVIGGTNRPISTIADFTEGAGLKAGNVLSFPPGLGGNPLGSGAASLTKTIPFTLFMPYKRANGGYTNPKAGLYSFQDNPLDTLPAPEFAIALPTTSDSLKTGYTVNYEQADIGQALGGLLVATQDTAKAGAAGAAAALAAFAATKSKMAAALAAVAGAGAMPGGPATQLRMAIGQQLAKAMGSSPEVVSLVMGVQQNPFTEYVYKNVAPRTHSFSYTFMPRTLSESEKIDQIINVFKYAMLPKIAKDTEDLLFNFPYEFQIVHSLDHTTFTMLPSVLQKCDVDYGSGTDSPKFFTSDYPARISMSLQFQEVILLTRDDVISIPEGSSDVDSDRKAGASKYRFRF